MAGRRRGRIVFSTDGGRHCPACGRPVADCSCREADPAPPPGDGIVRLRRQTRGRGGKTVTMVEGLPLDGAALKDLARRLKQRCGVGGAVRGGSIELQGDQRKLLLAWFEAEGYRAKIAGG